jgi:hypothetical protein
MVSLPTRGTNLRLTASSATRRTVQRARPSGGLLHTIAIKRCFCVREGRYSEARSDVLNILTYKVALKSSK